MRQLTDRPERLLRVAVGLACVAMLLAWSATCNAQRRTVDRYNPVDRYDPNQRGGVVIWIVSPDPDPRTNPQMISDASSGPVQYQEQTAGSFGATAGSVGRNAGDTGKTAGDLGVSTTSLAQAAAKANAVVRPPKFIRDSAWDGFTGATRFLFPRFSVKVVDVFDTGLQEKLTATFGTEDYPDLLAWNSIPGLRFDAAWVAQQSVTTLWAPVRWPQSEDSASWQTRFTPQIVLLSHARNPDSARAFLVGLVDSDPRIDPNKMTPQQKTAGDVAARVLQGLLQGEPVGADADPEMAGRGVPAHAVATGYAQPSRVEIRTDVENVQVGEHSAIAMVRAIGAGKQEFGVIGALLLLRKDSEGSWRVLQVSLDLPAELRARAVNFLVMAGHKGDALHVEGTRAMGISQAAPPDGDERSPEPELWWDNLGGATLQVVEWQPRPGPVSSLFFVPDTGSRVQTRVVARFANEQREYSWRVWSVGLDGAITVSPWRKLNIFKNQ